MRDYKNIKAFQYGDDLVIKVYQLTKSFPKEEIYGITSQLRRAATSVATNIAEGASRQHKRDYLHFLYISRASLSEAGYLLHLSQRLGYVTKDEFEKIQVLKEETARTLHGLITAVERETSQTPGVLLGL